MNARLQRSSQSALVAAKSRDNPTKVRGPLPNVADDVLAMLDPSVAEHPDFHDGWSGLRLRCVPLVEERPRPRSEILVTDVDVERLELTLSQHHHRADARRLSGLRGEIERATIVSPLAVPPDVITMNSRILCRGERSQDLWELQLVYPDDAEPHAGSMSVLSPFGTALLGLARGDLVESAETPWLGSRWWVSEVLYQPEREGHFHM